MRKYDKRWWTEDQIEVLRELRNVVSNSEIGVLIGRTTLAVQSKANELRLPPSMLCKRPWTDEDRDYLRQNYTHAGAKKCGEVLGRSPHACRIQAAHIGIYVYQRHAGVPPRRLYIAALQVAADAAEVKLISALSPSRVRKICHVRWRAWQTLYETGKYSTTGIGFVAKRDHSTILSGMKRLRLRSEQRPAP